MEKTKERIRPKKRYLHELPYSEIVKSGYIRLATSDKPEARLKLIVTGFTIFVYDSSCNYLFFGLLARFLTLLM